MVTGGAGFIGSNLVKRCLQEDYKVKVVDDFSTGRRLNLSQVESEIELIEGDVRDPDLLDEALADVELIFHQAATPSVPISMNKPVETTDSTLMGTVNLFTCAARADVNRVVYASSSSIYGNQPGFPRSEEMHPAPESPYAASKASCEYFGAVFAANFPLETVGLRYFNVFGPHQDPFSDYAAVVPAFITATLKGEQPVIYGDGEQSRDFTFVNDVVEANLVAAEKGENGNVYNVARQDKTTVNKLLDLVKSIAGSDIEPRYASPRPGDVDCSYGANQHLAEDTGFSPKYSVKEGLEETIQWYQNNPDQWSRSK